MANLLGLIHACLYFVNHGDPTCLQALPLSDGRQQETHAASFATHPTIDARYSMQINPRSYYTIWFGSGVCSAFCCFSSWQIHDIDRYSYPTCLQPDDSDHGEPPTGSDTRMSLFREPRTTFEWATARSACWRTLLLTFVVSHRGRSMALIDIHFSECMLCVVTNFCCKFPQPKLPIT